MCRASPLLELTENPPYSQVKCQTSLSSPRGTRVLYKGSGNTLSLVFGWCWAFWLSFNNNKRLKEKHLLLYSKVLSRNFEGFNLDYKPGTHLTEDEQGIMRT